MTTTVQFNASGWVTIPFFVVGQEAIDLADAVATLNKVRRANTEPTLPRRGKA